MAAGSASTKTLTGYYPSIDGQPQNVYLGAKPGTNATWTNFIAGTTTTDSALADCGWMPILSDGTTYRVPVLTAT